MKFCPEYFLWLVGWQFEEMENYLWVYLCWSQMKFGVGEVAESLTGLDDVVDAGKFPRDLWDVGLVENVDHATVDNYLWVGKIVKISNLDFFTLPPSLLNALNLQTNCNKPVRLDSRARSSPSCGRWRGCGRYRTSTCTPCTVIKFISKYLLVKFSLFGKWKLWKQFYN